MDTFKITIVGPSGVGKTTLVDTLIGKPSDLFSITMGVAISPLVVKTNKDTKILNLWDCGGKYTGMGIDVYSRGSKCIILILDEDTLDGRDIWWEKIAKLNIPHKLVWFNNKGKDFPMVDLEQGDFASLDSWKLIIKMVRLITKDNTLFLTQ